jgi:hypothetical protein
MTKNVSFPNQLKFMRSRAHSEIEIFRSTRAYDVMSVFSIFMRAQREEVEARTWHSLSNSPYKWPPLRLLIYSRTKFLRELVRSHLEQQRAHETISSTHSSYSGCMMRAARWMLDLKTRPGALEKWH